jgi:ribosomal protein S18 acetylase RimI-like enzyme
MALTRRRFDPKDDLRPLQDLSHRIWERDPSRLAFETSFGTLAWEAGGVGPARAFEDDGRLVAWARLTPGYERIRRVGQHDFAPPSLVWLVDDTIDDRTGVLAQVLRWARGGEARRRFTTSYAETDDEAAAFLEDDDFVPALDEPFGVYLQQPLTGATGTDDGAAADDPPAPPGYRFATMAEVGDVDARAEVHRKAWDGSARSGDDVAATMATWPYRPDLDLLAVADDGTLAASALAWYDAGYSYGEFEPVGTVPEHRGRGVGAALLRFGLARLARAGASHAVVGARGDDDYPLPRRVYRSVGFTIEARQVVVRPGSRSRRRPGPRPGAGG